MEKSNWILWLLASDFIFLRTQAVHITQQMEGNTQYDTEDIIKWKRKRLFTFIVFCLQYFVSGMVFTMLASTTWYYVVNQLRPKNPYVVYTVMTNLNYLPTVSLSLFTSSWHDKHRRTSLLVAINNYICMIGGIFYSISYSLYFPIFGCALLGARSLVQPIAIGELARSYPPEELTYKLPVVNFFLLSWIRSRVTHCISFRKRKIFHWITGNTKRQLSRNCNTFFVYYSSVSDCILCTQFITGVQFERASTARKTCFLQHWRNS